MDRLGDAYDPEGNLPIAEVVPDCDNIDWNHVPRSNEAIDETPVSTVLENKSPVAESHCEFGETRTQRREWLVGKVLAQGAGREVMHYFTTLLTADKNQALEGDDELLTMAKRLLGKVSELQRMIGSVESYMSAAEGFATAFQKSVAGAMEVFDLAAGLPGSSSRSDAKAGLPFLTSVKLKGHASATNWDCRFLQQGLTGEVL
jgi:hypothetical protein